jgi:hypothetical protein
MVGMNYVVHCASPFRLTGNTDFRTEFYDPAIKGTLEILRASKRAECTARSSNKLGRSNAPSKNVGLNLSIPLILGVLGQGTNILVYSSSCLF